MTQATARVQSNPDARLIGMDEDNARADCAKRGLLMRVRFRNGEPLVGTCDYDPKRVNVSVVCGEVIYVSGRG